MPKVSEVNIINNSYLYLMLEWIYYSTESMLPNRIDFLFPDYEFTPENFE